jgi:hypothetical protein
MRNLISIYLFNNILKMWVKRERFGRKVVVDGLLRKDCYYCRENGNF